MENYKVTREDSETVKLTKMWVNALVCIVVTLILTLSIYNVYRNHEIGKAIEKGYDPVIARLAFTHGTYETHERLVYLSGNKHIQKRQNLSKHVKVDNLMHMQPKH